MSKNPEKNLSHFFQSKSSTKFPYRKHKYVATISPDDLYVDGSGEVCDVYKLDVIRKDTDKDICCLSVRGLLFKRDEEASFFFSDYLVFDHDCLFSIHGLLNKIVRKLCFAVFENYPENDCDEYVSFEDYFPPCVEFNFWILDNQPYTEELKSFFLDNGFNYNIYADVPDKLCFSFGIDFLADPDGDRYHKKAKKG